MSRKRTVQVGASLTKMLFAYTVMQLLEERKPGLAQPIAQYLPKPLPEYADEAGYSPWHHLAGDERWRKLTPSMLFTHSTHRDTRAGGNRHAVDMGIRSQRPHQKVK